MDAFCSSHKETFAELDRVAPGAPFLALGQTVFWDEPMKAGVLLCARDLGFSREFVAGVHDTDYFAKHSGSIPPGTFAALPHNDTTTRDLWSAAGEFSALFGSETVITREILTRAGAKLARIQPARPSLLDEVTEAYGWRGVAFGGENSPIVAELPLGPTLRPLLETLDWAIKTTLEAIPVCQATGAKDRAAELKSLACDLADDHAQGTLASYYQALLPHLYRFASGNDVEMESTRTTELLQFNTETASKTRFKIIDAFLNPETRAHAIEAYNAAVRHTETYTLDRFGSWAIPFDLVIPGVGRGTLRIAPRAVVIMTGPTPQFITTKKPITSVEELAAAITRKLGPNCTLVGKAITLIGMLSSEFVFVFHEGASGYVHRSRAFHQGLRSSGLDLKFNPILRVKYDTWGSMEECNIYLKLPQPLRRPFGSEELSAKTFGARWKLVAEAQRDLLRELTEIRRPVELIRFLSQRFSQSWKELERRYDTIHVRSEELHAEVDGLRTQKREALKAWRAAKAERAALERAMGEHWRATIFEKSPTEQDHAQRAEFKAAISEAQRATREALSGWSALQAQQDSLVKSDEILALHRTRRELELEAEIERVRLIREAVTVGEGLKKAAHRPSAWWFGVVCSDGDWFKATVNRAQYYLEPLQ